MKVHKPTWQLAISFLWPWCPLCQQFLYCWSHSWTPEDLPQLCSRQIFVLFSAWKRKKQLTIEQSFMKMYMIILFFQGIFKYGWTPPQWPPWGKKKVAIVALEVPKRDQHQFSPNNIHALWREKGVRINKMITKWIMIWSFIKFSQLHVIL